VSARRQALFAFAVCSAGLLASQHAFAAAPAKKVCVHADRTDVPSIGEYEQLAADVTKQKAALDAAIEARDAAASARDAASVEFAADTAVPPSDVKLKAATLAFGEADIVWRNAREALECAERRDTTVWNVYRLNQVPPDSIGFGLSVAGGAGGVNRAGGSVRYLSRPSVPNEYELSLALDSIRTLDAAERYAALSPRFRVSFGTSSTSFFLGAGPTFILRETLRVAAVGQIGAAVRNVFGHADARLFAEPWVPLDGAPVTVLFGVELGAVFGLGARNKAGVTAPWVDWQLRP
jgi:hypothetical protein